MILILYGSQTGNSAYIARKIKKMLMFGLNDEIEEKERRIKNKKLLFVEPIECMELDDFNLDVIHQFNKIIFVCSTHGDGEEPFNMRLFWKFLKLKSLSHNFLSHLQFALYGLGDSSYLKFNYCGKMLFNRLKSLGAKEIIPRYDGDLQDIEGYNTTFIPFIEELIKFIATKTNDNILDEKLYKKVPDIFYGKIISTQFLTSTDYANPILEIGFEVSDYADFNPGDCLGIFPENYNYINFIKYNNICIDDAKSNNFALNFIKNISLLDHFTTDVNLNGIKSTPIEYLLKSYFDINFLPFQSIFRNLASVLEQNIISSKLYDLKIVKLLEISTDYEIYHNYILQPRRSFYEVIQDFSIIVNIEFLIEFVPAINLRYFTLIKKNSYYYINLTIVNYKTIIKEPRKGLCSEYLKSISINTKIRVKISKSILHFNSKKIIFICTGTGITLPFSFLNFFTGFEIMIFYGFRFRQEDRLHFETIKTGNFNGNIVTVHEAPSREFPFKYVQSIFSENLPRNIEDYIIFVSGNSRLNKEIRNMLTMIYKRNIPFQSETW